MMISSGSGTDLTLIDQGPNHYDAAVGNLAKPAPTIVPNVLNGNSILRLVAADQNYMKFGGTNPVIFPNQGATTVVVAKYPAVLNNGDFQTFLTNASGVNKYQGFSMSNADGYSPLTFGGGNGSLPAVASVGVDGFDYSSAFFTLVIEWNGGGDFSNVANYEAFRDGVTNTVIQNGTAGTAASQSLIGAWPSAGPGLFAGMDVAMIIGFAEKLGPAKRAKLSAYLISRFGVGITI